MDTPPPANRPPVVLVAMDKFKGSLSAADAVAAVARGIRRARPGWRIIPLPLADGGDGTTEVLAVALDGEWRHADVTDALARPLRAPWLFFPRDPAGPWALIEMSAASGLRHLAPAERDPAHATTFGSGQLVRAAITAGARRIVVGLGGSATNDGGAGFARALGHRFLDAAETEITDLPLGLTRLARIDSSAVVELPPMVGLCDVPHPLLGPGGATATFGPQKGVSPDQAPRFEAALARLAAITATQRGHRRHEHAGAGAAGGLGFGLLAFADARLRGGFDWIAEKLDVARHVAAADLVVTGEGALDAQSGKGKVPGELLALARHHGRPVVAFAGRIEQDLGFATCRSIIDVEPDSARAIAHAAILLESIAENWASTTRLAG